jgi:hypothetical protein
MAQCPDGSVAQDKDPLGEYNCIPESACTQLHSCEACINQLSPHVNEYFAPEDIVRCNWCVSTEGFDIGCRVGGDCPFFSISSDGLCYQTLLYRFVTWLAIAGALFGIGLIFGSFFCLTNARADQQQKKRTTLYLYVIAFLLWGTGTNNN